MTQLAKPMSPASPGRCNLWSAGCRWWIFLLAALSSWPAIAELASVEQMRAMVSTASRPAQAWNGPLSGPAALNDKALAIVAEDLQNGGILGVAQGIDEAGKVIGWRFKVLDAAGTEAGRKRAFADALAGRPDGLIILGMDAKVIGDALKPFVRQGIPIIGWHVGPQAGPMPESSIAMNVSTDPLQVARVTAMAAVTEARADIGIVIFTDSNYAIAMAKANAMADVVRACRRCTLLEIRDVAISAAAERMPGVTRDLIKRYGKRWTHALAINDIYFDYAVPELIRVGLPNDALRLLSAGDGSSAAFMRIQAGAFQTATVAEPLLLHGWQLVDEMNRLLAKRSVSGYIIPVHLVTGANIAHDGGPQLRFDPDNGYRDVYRGIWKR